MPIEVGFWRIDEKPVAVNFSAIETEKRLEDVLCADLSILAPDLLLIGRQVPTSHGKFVDLLALDREGNLVVIELKKDKTPREVVAQLLDYGSWVTSLEDDDIAGIFERYVSKYDTTQKGKSLDEAFCEMFDLDDPPEVLNESHELLVVAAQLDDSTERIISYLIEFGVAINAVFFRFFKDGECEYLSRAWLVEPDQAEAKIVEKREKLPWNGEYYVSFGSDERRDWEEARKYGFISAGGGAWYTRTLSILEEGSRIWVNIPGGVGYVGVGRVIEGSVPIDEFKVDDGSGNQVPITKMPLKAAQHDTMDNNPDKAEHVVRVEWIHTLPLSEAVKEKGFFGNQNSAAKPRAKKWQHTVERLKTRFGVKD
ncbi:MAG: endonuclease NucS domain-containing protein [Planctomycetota bacterium]